MNTRRTQIVLALLAASCGASVRAAEPKFPLKLSENRRHLVDQGGMPFLYNADTPWMLFTKLTVPEAKEYIPRRKEQGFTALQVILTGFLGMTNLAGELPYAGTPPEHDFAQPNEKFFAHVDRVVAEAQRQGMLLAIAPAWSGCCGEGWAGKEKDGALKPLNANGAEKSRELGRWLGQRYGKFDNILWLLGGDNDPHNARAEIRALSLGLKDTAPRQLITYHAASTHSSTDVWPADEPWLDVSMVYSYFRGFNKAWNKNQPDIYEVSHAEFPKIPVRPFFLGESTYEGEHGDWGSALQARKQAYWAVLGGGFGHAYGSPNWHLRDDWRKVVALPGAESLRHLRHLFTVRPFFELEPDVKNTVTVGGQGRYATNDWATTARARDGRFVIAYLPSPRALEIDLSKVAGKQARVSWMDAATGEMHPGGTVATQGVKKFSPPEADKQKDWVLILDDAEAPLAELRPGPGKTAALQSVDHRGDCRHGVPAKDGETILLPKEKGLSLVAYGSEYGHHCGQDQGRFAYVPLAGDFDVAVQVSAITNDGEQHFKKHATPAKAGLMLRDGNGPADRYVAIWAVSNDALEHYPDAFHFDARLVRGAWLGSKPKGEFVYGYVNRKHGELFVRNYPNVWVRLKRTGDRVAAFVSKDAQTWASPSTPAFELPLPEVVYVGVALSSAPEGSFEARSTATFKNLSGFSLDAN